MEFQPKPSGLHKILLLAPVEKPPTPPKPWSTLFDMGKFSWQPFLFNCFILYLVFSSPSLVSMFEMFFEANYELLTRVGSWVKSEENQWVIGHYVNGHHWLRARPNLGELASSEKGPKEAPLVAPYPAPTVLWALQPHKCAAAQISFTCSRVSVSRSFF